MKKIFSCLVAGIFSVGIFGQIVFAADVLPKIHHFNIITVPTTKENEAIDVTVEAKDKDDKTISNYRGSVFFQSTSDFTATLPAQGKSIQFKESDNGVLKLSKAIVFKHKGNQTLQVSDAVEDAEGVVTIKVDPADVAGTTTGSGESITIITPENNSSVTSDTITVSGKTKKNSKVSIKLNGVDVGTTQSLDSGIFTQTIPNITQSTNILTVSIFDGTNKVVGTAESRFTLADSGPKYYNTTIRPSNTVDAGSPVSLTIEAEPGLSEVSATIDGSVMVAKEVSSGKYNIDTIAPAHSGSYQVNIALKNSLSKIQSKQNAITLTVNEKAVVAPNFKNVKIVTEGNKATFTFSVENITPEVTKFKIAYGENPDSLTEQVVTNEVEKIKNGSGEYTWYINNLTPKTYTFKIFGMKADGSLISNFSSEALNGTIGKNTCSIGNVGTIHTETGSGKSILSWDTITGAVSYNIYKINAAGEYSLLQNTKDNKYIIFLASGAIVHEDFGIKALCDDTTESPSASLASKVQTGPGMIGFLVVLSGIIGILIIRRRTA